MADLDAYNAKRDFAETPEPSDPGRPSALAPRYSMQRHAARRLHYDLRLEHRGVLLSFAVTRGPSLDPAEKRLAVRTEDHPLSYLDFEGVIPPGNYGAGTVMLFDIGHWQPFHDVEDGFARGHIHFALHGARLTGGWSLVRLGGRPGDARRENWLLVKDDDAAAHEPDPLLRYPASVSTNRAMDAVTSGAKPRPFGPRRVAAAPKPPRPQLAAGGGRIDDTDGRWFELKLDGYRALVTLGAGGARIFTRNGHDWTDRFAPLLPLIESLPARRAVIDAEIVAGAGLQGFSALQSAVGAGGPFRLVAFDLLNIDGRDLTDRPLTARRAALEKLFADVPPLGPLRLSPVIEGDVATALDLICSSGGEGLISKRTDARYRPGRSDIWQKIRCDRRDDFLIVGWEPSPSPARPFTSLLLAQDTDAGLTFRGRVGTGFDDAAIEDLARRMAPLAVRAAPVTDHDAKKPRWVAPRLRAEVKYTETTPDGRLRHPVYLGLRDDLPAPVVRAATVRSGDRKTVAGVAISHPDRVVFPDAGLTKASVAAYYARVAPRMLPHLRDRPLSLVRLPDGLTGERFFQKHVGKGFPEGIEAHQMGGPKGPREVMTISTTKGLLGAVQMGAVEFHIGGARLDLPDRPDRLVIDLDPDEGLSFAAVKRAALDIADDLRGLGLDPWPLATGGKGIHVVVPLQRRASWETVTLFARTYAALKAQSHPDRFTDSISKSRREGRIFLDWLRNEPTATAVCPWSLRARDGAPLAHPLTWPALKAARKMPKETPKTLRLAKVAEPKAKAVVLGEKVIEGLAGLV